jgi:D-alanine-D-alanine ligase
MSGGSTARGASGRKKLRVGIVFGGRSGEHEVSLMSARSVVAGLDPEKYEIIGIGITREGRWLLTGDPLAKLLEEAGGQLEPTPESRIVALAPDPSSAALVPLDASSGAGSPAGGVRPSRHEQRPDVLFPLIHGTHGEDGSLQGLFELAELPYVGSGILASAVGMDKAVFKAVMQAHGIPVPPYRLIVIGSEIGGSRIVGGEIEARDSGPAATDGGDSRSAAENDWIGLARELGYPLFVKPANGGSSLGVTKVKEESELAAAVRGAADYDRRVLLEQAIDCRELECAVLGNDAPEASVAGEVIPGHEFYDYDDKYFDDKARLEIPARLSAEQMAAVRELSVRAFKAIDGAGMARVDFFLERGTDALFVSEINTIPGFTRISMYPKLWEASGLPFPRLLDRLILLALERAEGMRHRKLSP